MLQNTNFRIIAISIFQKIASV